MIAFVRTETGVTLTDGAFSLDLRYAEIAALNAFIASGATSQHR